MFRLFQLHVFGVREYCVESRQGRARERIGEAVWDNSASSWDAEVNLGVTAFGGPAP